MPFEIISLGRGKYEVKNSETDEIHSKHTTKKNAQAQVRLLNQVSKGEGFKGNASDFVQREKEATDKAEMRSKMEQGAKDSLSNSVQREKKASKSVKDKLDDISNRQQESFIKNEQMRTKPKVDLSHLAKPIGEGVAPKIKKVKIGGVIGIGDHHIAKMGL